VVLQGCYRVLKGCYKGDNRVIKVLEAREKGTEVSTQQTLWWYGGVTMTLQWCYSGVTGKLQWCYRVLKGC
jgi:hypothetical protein